MLPRYVKGGAASGFTHVEHTFKPRLLHVKGKHTPRIKEVQLRARLDALTADRAVRFGACELSLCTKNVRVCCIDRHQPGALKFCDKQDPKRTENSFSPEFESVLQQQICVHFGQ